ncbi:hypothetical protein D3C80_1935980 [compost metagenome]
MGMHHPVHFGQLIIDPQMHLHLCGRAVALGCFKDLSLQIDLNEHMRLQIAFADPGR